jgi:hypothetical protein
MLLAVCDTCMLKCASQLSMQERFGPPQAGPVSRAWRAVQPVRGWRGMQPYDQRSSCADTMDTEHNRNFFLAKISHTPLSLPVCLCPVCLCNIHSQPQGISSGAESTAGDSFVFRRAARLAGRGVASEYGSLCCTCPAAPPSSIAAAAAAAPGHLGLPAAAAASAQRGRPTQHSSNTGPTDAAALAHPQTHGRCHRAGQHPARRGQDHGHSRHRSSAQVCGACRARETPAACLLPHTPFKTRTLSMHAPANTTQGARMPGGELQHWHRCGCTMLDPCVGRVGQRVWGC